jgi:prolipoprotein diacylglyceryl transferase
MATPAFDFIFEVVQWEADPIAFTVFGRGIRWYGIFYAISFLVGHQLLQRVYKQEGKPEKDLDALAVTTILSVIIGARLGHCIFYDPQYYIIDNPHKIFYIWEGGMASHGAAIGIAIGLWLYTRKRADQSWLWAADRILIAVAFGAILIRVANLINSEIVGQPTDLPWGFVFLDHPLYNQQARHPVQLYEAGSYLIIFAMMILGYFKWHWGRREGMLAGFFLATVFAARFVIEFFKVEQANFDLPLITMGQLLSVIPAVAGAVIMYRALRRPKSPPPTPRQDEPQRSNTKPQPARQKRQKTR